MGVPTRDLLPNYMRHQRWLDLADAIDAVFGAEIELQMKALQYIRHQFIDNDTVNERAADQLMVRSTDWDKLDRQTAALQTELLGLKLSDSTYVDQDAFTNLVRNLGTFWFSKGTRDFVDFIAFTLNARIELDALWTQDYETFVTKDEVPTGELPVWQGGLWYPTTHVRLSYDNSTLGINNVILLARLFYDLSNYNLVLHAIAAYNNMYIAELGAVPHTNGLVTASIVALGNVMYETISIDTEV